MRRTQFVDVTKQVHQAVEKSRVSNGVCHVYVPHTTAAVMINECADPDVATDLEGAFDRLIPFEGPYRHEEGNSDSHEIRFGGRERDGFCGRRETATGALAGNFLLRI